MLAPRIIHLIYSDETLCPQKVANFSQILAHHHDYTIYIYYFHKSIADRLYDEFSGKNPNLFIIYYEDFYTRYQSCYGIKLNRDVFLKKLISPVKFYNAMFASLIFRLDLLYYVGGYYIGGNIECRQRLYEEPLPLQGVRFIAKDFRGELSDDCVVATTFSPVIDLLRRAITPETKPIINCLNLLSSDQLASLQLTSDYYHSQRFMSSFANPAMSESDAKRSRFEYPDKTTNADVMKAGKSPLNGLMETAKILYLKALSSEDVILEMHPLILLQTDIELYFEKSFLEQHLNLSDVNVSDGYYRKKYIEYLERYITFISENLTAVVFKSIAPTTSAVTEMPPPLDPGSGNYVHFYWAGDMLSYSTCQLLAKWSAHLGIMPGVFAERYQSMIGTQVMAEREHRYKPFVGKTKFIPILWCGASVYQTLVISHSTVSYDEAIKFIPLNWRESYLQLRQDLTGIEKCFWVAHKSKLPINIFIINLEQYLAEQHKINLIFQEVIDYYHLCNGHKLYQLPKDIILMLVVWRYSGFSFDMDIQPGHRSFLFEKRDLYADFLSYCRANRFDPKKLNLKMLKFMNIFDPSADQLSDGKRPQNDVGMLFSYFANPDYFNDATYLRNVHKRIYFKASAIHILDSRARIEKHLKHSQLYNNLHDPLRNLQQQSVSESMGKFKESPNNFANELSLKNSAYDPLSEYVFWHQHPCRDLFSLLSQDNMVSIDSDPQKKEFTDYVKFYIRYFFPLFKQLYFRVPSSLSYTGYQKIAELDRAVASLSRYFRDRHKVLKFELRGVPIQGEKCSLYIYFNALFLLNHREWKIDYGKITIVAALTRECRTLKIIFTSTRNVENGFEIYFIKYDQQYGHTYALSLPKSVDPTQKEIHCQFIRVLSGDDDLYIYYRIANQQHLLQLQRKHPYGKYTMTKYSCPLGSFFDETQTRFQKDFVRLVNLYQAHHSSREHVPIIDPIF
jgi:hypothetical protein